MELSPGFWRGRRVLVSGHTGFKGSWMSLWLQEMGAELAGVGLGPPSEPSLFQVARVGDGMRCYEADVRDLDAVSQAFAEHDPEVAIHMAAQPIVSVGLKDPVATFEANVMGAVNMLDAARRSGSLRAFVNVTSDKCYETIPRDDGYREGDLLGGRDPYSASKACSELVTAAYRSSYFQDPDGPAVATARAGNVIGGGDWGKDRLVPDLMRAAIDGTPMRIRRPRSVRPWQHVLEPVSGYLLLAERLCGDPVAYADAWNFAPDQADAWPVDEVVARVRELWSDSIAVDAAGGDQFLETHYLGLDSSRAREQLGWRPGWGLDSALEAVVGWYREWSGGADARRLTIEQIRSHPAASSLRAAA